MKIVGLIPKSFIFTTHSSYFIAVHLSGTGLDSDRNTGVEKAQPKSDCQEQCNRGNNLQS
jgi:hypothetical protein